jgi:hypothetical protein
MKGISILISILIVGFAHGQTADDKLSDKAFDFFLKNKYDSALYYYKIFSQDFPEKHPLYISNQIADCYLELADTANAEKYYLKCLSIDKGLLDSVVGVSQLHACFSLSNIYLNRKQFRKALTYLDFTKSKYKPLRMLCQGTHGGYEAKLEFAYSKALCYYGLNKKDSAIKELGPLIFRPRWDVYLDSLEFEEMTRFYVNTIFEVYGTVQPKDKLQYALKNLTYVGNYDQTTSTIMYSVDCFISFAGTKINLDTGGGYGVDKVGDIPDAFSKENLLKEFTDSPAYQYIMSCKFVPVSPNTGSWLSQVRLACSDK